MVSANLAKSRIQKGVHGYSKFVFNIVAGAKSHTIFMKVFLGPHAARQDPPPAFFFTPNFFQSACRALSPRFCGPI